MQFAVYEAYYKIVMPNQSTDVLKRYVARCFAYGVVGLLDEWVKRNFQETPQELIQIANKSSS